MNALSIHINGIAEQQEVELRPFVYHLATDLGLTGWLRNSEAGLDIELEGDDLALDEFVRRVRADAPPPLHLEQLDVTPHAPTGYRGFELESGPELAPATLLDWPDASICPDCLRELFDPRNRRHRYPFIDCVHCGPRFTSIKELPYERSRTTLAFFPMCADCSAEVTNPDSRRFQAASIACPECGPRVWLETKRPESPSGRANIGSYTLGDEAILACQRLLREGRIVAIKGLGGFHLACDALNPEAVPELRRRKLHTEKPFALMLPNLAAVEQHCYISPDERALLESPARPIVLLRRRPESTIVEQVAPGQEQLGIMLPYTPLHYLLFADPPNAHARPLVMTDANLAGEPICTDNVEARQHLSALADAFLMHDRDIHNRADDSVMRILPDLGVYPIRRSRGYVPTPIQLPWRSAPVLAVGARWNNTFCLTDGQQALTSHHIGDLDNDETLQSFTRGIAHFEKLLGRKPVALACDLHPDYLSSRYARERAERESLALVPVQHQHAHLAALMAEHGLDGSEPLLGVAFGGSSYGQDGAIWGGEFLLADYAVSRRMAHLRYFPLPGGADAASLSPSRAALGLLHALGLGAENQPGIESAPLTSSVGHLFAAVATLSGLRQQANYAAQAAVEFEALADPDETGLYPFEFAAGQVDPAPLVAALLADVRAGKPVRQVSARFHNSLAHLVRDVCASLRVETGVSKVALSGGVWQNVTLLLKTIPLLQKAGFQVYIHHKIPANDGGLAFGQAAVAAWKFK